MHAGVNDPGSADTQTFAWKVYAASQTTKDAQGNLLPTFAGTGQAFTFTPATSDNYTVVLVATDDDSGVRVFALRLDKRRVPLPVKVPL